MSWDALSAEVACMFGEASGDFGDRSMESQIEDFRQWRDAADWSRERLFDDCLIDTTVSNYWRLRVSNKIRVWPDTPHRWHLCVRLDAIRHADDGSRPHPGLLFTFDTKRRAFVENRDVQPQLARRAAALRDFVPKLQRIIADELAAHLD